MKTNNKLVKVIGIIFTISSLVLFAFSVFMNDKYIPITIFAAIMGSIAITKAGKSNNIETSKPLSKREKLMLKISLVLTVVLIIVGVIFAIYSF
jgi:uncharacterized membrane protein YidH (DUF202 family)